MHRLLLAALSLAASVTIAAAVDKPNAVVGTKAPALTLSGLDGKSVSFDSLRGKTATVVLFVSFDCPVSTSYMPELNALAKSHTEKGVTVVFVCPTDEPREAVAKAASGFKLTVPVLLDPKKEFAAGLKACATPEAFLLDGDGVVRYRGRIDDGYSSRLKRNREVTAHDLLDALNAVIDNKPVRNPVTTAIGCAIDIETASLPKNGAVTFYKHVAPILNAHCVVCHRSGEVGPFSLTSYNQSRRWAGDIKEYTENRQMPPWMPAHGLPMKGERKLTSAEIATLAAWSDAGAPEGDPKDAPKAPDFGDGWRNGKPDLILTPDRDFHLAGSGNDLFRVFVIPTGLTENKWVVGYDVKPGNPRVVHHTLNFFDGSGQARDLEKKQLDKDKGRDLADSGPGYNVAMGVGFVAAPGKAGEAPKFGGIGGWAPGQAPQFLPQGAGWLLPKGADFLIQTHYHRNGQPTNDRTQIGLYFAKEEIDLPWQTILIQGLKTWERIPAGKSDFLVRGSIYFHTSAVLHNVLPHMHLLGKSVSVTMTPPGGKPVVLVDIPAWDYRWQETYWFKEPIEVKAGTKLEVQAHFDNSEANPNNPTKPPREVSYGEQTTDEMLFAFFGVTSAVKPSQRVRTYSFPPEGLGEAPIKGKLTPLLEGLVGTWETTTDVKVLGRPVSLKGKDIAEKAFSGTFVRSTATTEGDNRGLVFLYTFDSALDRYHMWMFDPLGTELEWTGSYDEKTKSIAWTATLSDDVKGKMNWKFAESGGYLWDLVITTNGKPSLEISGDRSKKKQ
ncbi:MAG TPA: redoxin family protein [Gemmata sp.]|nr:redoxin family protein [Gemmata sp.]